MQYFPGRGAVRPGRPPIGTTAGLALLLALAPGAVLAHAPIAGVGAFWNGVAHPLVVPLHALALIALGLVMGLDAPRTSRTALPLFGAAVLAATLLADAAPPPAVLLAAAAAVGGLLVAFERASPAPVGALAVIAGLLVGLDSAPDAYAAGNDLLARIGTVSGTLLLVTLAGGASAALRSSWQRISVRVLGSWIAAAAIVIGAALFAAMTTPPASGLPA